MKRVSKIIIPGLIIFGIIFSSCRKKTREEDNDTTSASDDFVATSIGNDMANIADEAGRTQSVSSFKTNESFALLSACASLQFDTLVNSNADTITVNFGSNNCTCSDGRTRRGSLVITYNGKYKDSLVLITITPKNYFVNDNGVSGSKTIKNLGHNQQGHLVYEITENISIAKVGGNGTITFTANRRREWLTGENTLSWLDDRYSITGSSSGTSAGGRSFTSTITIPLLRDMSAACRKHFVSGTIVHQPDGKPERTIDFGDGTCDNKATVTINNKVYEITLP